MKKSCYAHLVVFALFSPLFVQANNLDFSFDRCEAGDPHVVLSFTGDILVHDGLYRHVMTSPERFYSLWRETKPLFEKADFSYANLEGPTALGIDRNGRDHGDVGFTYDLKIYSGTNFLFNYHPSILLDLERLGLDILSTSNNHSLDRRPLGIDRTLEAFAQTSLIPVGTRHSQEANGDFQKIVDVKGFRIAWISCTEFTNGIPDKKNQLLLCYKDHHRIMSLIRELDERADVDALIITPHWGNEYEPRANQSQKSLGAQWIRAGANIVIGNHPHVLQAWEKVDAGNGRSGLVVYSLGNFLAYQKGLEKKTSAVVYLQLTKGQNDQKARISGVAYTPTYREGTQVRPAFSTEVFKHAAQHYGTKNLVGPSEDLNFSCQ